MEPLFPKRFACNNLLPYHQTALCFLKNQSKFLVINCDKNMGLAIIETSIYRRRALDHLNNRETYKSIKEGQADGYKETIKGKIGQ
eukprot:15326859-Ditylum_brightwellii.AAC.1